MDVFSLPTTAKAGLGLAVVYLLYILITSIALWSRRRAFKREKGVLEARKHAQLEPFWGLDLFIENLRALKQHRLLELSHSRFEEMGVNTYQLVVMGRHAHATREPENLKVIQAMEFKKWSLGTGRKVNFRPLLGIGIFTTDGPEWQHSRDMLRPNFVRSQVGDVETFERHVVDLIKAIPPKSYVDLSVLFFRLTIDSATEFLFGESTGSLTKGNDEGFSAAFQDSQDFIADRWGPFAKLFIRRNRKFAQDCKFVHDFVDYFVEKGLRRREELLKEKANENERNGRYVFIDELVRQTNDPVRIRDELLNILLAGRDTTASLLTNVWFVLSRRPDIWNCLKADVARLNGKRPSFEQLKDLKYLKAVLNESLRLHPVVPLNSREAIEDTTLPVGGGPDGHAPIFIKVRGDKLKPCHRVWNVY